MEQGLHPILARLYLTQAANRITKRVVVHRLRFIGLPPVNVDAEHLLCRQVFADLKAWFLLVVGGNQSQQTTVKIILAHTRWKRHVKANVRRGGSFQFCFGGEESQDKYCNQQQSLHWKLLRVNPEKSCQSCPMLDK